MMMQDVIVRYLERPQLDHPVLIEGLPGVGNVGKLAAEHLVDELKLKKFADLFSKYLPPQVMVGDDGTIRLVRHELFYGRDMGKGKDIVVLAGDFQGLTPEGQYELASVAIGIAKDLGVELIFTLGGYGVIKLMEEPSVLGAVTEPSLRKEMETLGVIFRKGEPSSGIIGASGILLGLGELEGIPGICLMGETSGYFVDPRSARSVLKVLAAYIGLDLDYTKLDEKARQIDEITSRIKENIEDEVEEGNEDLRYFG